MLRVLCCLTLLIVSLPALAHPHVWVVARAEVLYAPGGKVAGVRHAWTFDETYSTYVTQGLDKNNDGKLTPDELEDLAKTNVESLAEYDYFTVLKANGAKQALGAPRDYAMSVVDGLLTLRFTLPLKVEAPNRLSALEVYDPTAFVSFSIAEGDQAVTLRDGPKGCALTITRAKPMEVSDQQKMSESFFQALTAASTYGANFANRVLVACP